MPTTDAIERAKADIAEFDRKINLIAAEESRLELQRHQMEHERDRIRAFVEMYQRYTTDQTTPSPKAPVSIAKPLEQPKKTTRERAKLVVDRKPDNIPPMTEMITTALKVGIEHGHKGLEPREMTNFIRQKWWPSVKGESVSPIAWRMAQNGQLKKEGNIYKLPS